MTTPEPRTVRLGLDDNAVVALGEIRGATTALDLEGAEMFVGAAGIRPLLRSFRLQ